MGCVACISCWKKNNSNILYVFTLHSSFTPLPPPPPHLQKLGNFGGNSCWWGGGGRKMLLSAINTAPLSAHRLLNFRITQFIQLKANKSNTIL